MPASAPSYWLEEALKSEQGEPCPPLSHDRQADVCIVGGGYTGLWTALRLKSLEPSLDVALIDAHYCGYGASGRNAGFLLTWNAKFPLLAEYCGAQEALRLVRESRAVLGEVESFCQAHAIDCQFRRTGWLWTAANAAQRDAWRPTLDALDKVGDQPFTVLTAEEAVRRSGSPSVAGAVFDPTAAILQPAMLARGLRRAALAAGVRIYENTRMLALERGRPPRVRTARGTITAKKVVLGLNAWASEMPEFRRTVICVASDQHMTAPIPDRLASVGLGQGLAFSDSRLLVFGYRTTVDGRINFSKGGGDFAFAGRVGSGFHEAATRTGEVVEVFHRLYPSLKDVPIVESWRGPVTRTPHGLPMFGHSKGHPDILYGHGYCGNGVGPSFIGGRILASLALERSDEWSSIPLVNARPKMRFPPEPFRYVGAYAVRAAIRRKERAEDEGRVPRRIDTWLAGLAPAGLTPTNDEK
ncbi:MAG: FAD-dependent oxidoreductase [Alphaproteobacteria bacterium]